MNTRLFSYLTLGLTLLVLVNGCAERFARGAEQQADAGLALATTPICSPRT